MKSAGLCFLFLVFLSDSFDNGEVTLILQSCRLAKSLRAHKNI